LPSQGGPPRTTPKVLSIQQDLITGDQPDRSFPPRPECRAPQMDTDSIWIIDTAEAPNATSNAVIRVFEIGLEALIQRPYDIEEFAAE